MYGTDFSTSTKYGTVLSIVLMKLPVLSIVMIIVPIDVYTVCTNGYGQTVLSLSLLLAGSYEGSYVKVPFYLAALRGVTVLSY